MEYSISELTIYPIKALGGISLQTAKIDATGFEYDRRWMLIDADDQFISQREIPSLCLFKLQIINNTIEVSFTNDQLIIPLILTKGTTKKVKVWDDEVTAIVAEHQINKWFSERIGQPVALVYMPNETQRLVDQKYTQLKSVVSFADAYPLLIVGESSIGFLQSKINEPVYSNQFRANIIFKGGQPHCEDDWKTISIGNNELHIVKPSARCVVITINQATAIASKEPLKTLATYRASDNKILFGQNIVTQSNGSISIGDIITVLSKK